MPEDSFAPGSIRYEVKETPIEEAAGTVSLNEWDDGYLAFSRGEARLPEYKDEDFDSLLKKRFDGKVDGYLMEVDLWKSGSGVFEEVSVEREDRHLLVQHWTLDTNDKALVGDEKTRCYWRAVETFPLERSLFSKGELKSIEVVWPVRRLHFFITVRGNDGNQAK